jgi:hypothetical protein
MCAAVQAGQIPGLFSARQTGSGTQIACFDGCPSLHLSFCPFVHSSIFPAACLSAYFINSRAQEKRRQRKAEELKQRVEKAKQFQKRVTSNGSGQKRKAAGASAEHGAALDVEFLR